MEHALVIGDKVDHARTRLRAKRQRDARKVSLDEAAMVFQDQAVDLLALHEALERLEAIDERKGRIVELRFFGGLSIEETAEVLGIGHATVERDWKLARAWLRRQLQ